MSLLECRVCTADVVDALLCRSCSRELEQAIAELPALLRELDVTVTRQDRGTGAALYAMHKSRLEVPGLHYPEGTTTLPSTPWPFSWDAASLRWAVVNTLTTWARHLLESRGVDLIEGPAHERCGHRTCQQLRQWMPAHEFLLANLEAIRQDEAAAQIHDELVSTRYAILRAIDRQEPDVYAGRCDAPDITVGPDGWTLTMATCGADIYARLGEAQAKCQACGAVYDMATRKTAMLDTLDDQWARAHVIASACTTLDEPVKVDTLYKWIERGHVRQVGIDDDGHALYRVGDVRDRIALMAERRKA